jgi:hypothetical protein
MITTGMKITTAVMMTMYQ